MAWQLGGDRLYAKLAKADEQKIAPGTDLLGEVLAEAGPCLILLDEVLAYLLKAGGVKTGDSTLRGNTLIFLQELSIAVANCPTACMIATLTSQLAEYMDEGGERAYESLEKVLGRVEKVRQTVVGAEIYEVIRRRLFESLGDPADHRAAAEAYWQVYRQLGEDVPSGCREPSYREEMIRSYPFHPELITVLYERWGTIAEFQRTRGVLRLLADVISNLYQGKDNDPLIQSGSVNLGSASRSRRTRQTHRLRQCFSRRHRERHRRHPRQGPRDQPPIGQRICEGERVGKARSVDLHVFVQRRAAAGQPCRSCDWPCSTRRWPRPSSPTHWTA